MTNQTPKKPLTDGEIALMLNAEESFYEFCLQAFRVIEPETEFLENWHMREIASILEKHIHRIGRKEPKAQDLNCNVPPGSSKSMIFSVALNAWAWIHYPWMRFANASYSSTLSVELCVKSRDLIQSEWYQRRWGKTVELKKAADSFFKNTKGGQRFATSVGGAITGFHVDVVIGDDLLNPQSAASEAERATANDFWLNTVPSRFRNLQTGLKILVMQRLHEMDTAGIVMDKGLAYEHIVIPAELSEIKENEVLTPIEWIKHYVDGLYFPARFSREVLGEKEKELGSEKYSAQYMQRPTPADGEAIKKGWFGYFRAGELPEDIKRDFYADTAYGKKKGVKGATKDSDNSAVATYSVHNGNLYIWNIAAVNLKYPKFKKWLIQHLLSQGYTFRSRVHVEPKATGITVVQDLEETVLSDGSRLNIIEDEAPTDSKETRVDAIAPTLEAGRVFLLEGAEWIPAFLHECAAFPKGKNDDRVDVLEGAVRKGLQKKKTPGIGHV